MVRSLSTLTASFELDVEADFEIDPDILTGERMRQGQLGHSLESRAGPELRKRSILGEEDCLDVDHGHGKVVGCLVDGSVVVRAEVDRRARTR